jgi:hypothetical protein
VQLAQTSLDAWLCVLHTMRMFEPSVDRIKFILDEAGQSHSDEAANRICAQVRACNGLDEAIAATCAQGDLEFLAELTAFRAALAEAIMPALKARRLRSGAADLDERAERLMTQAAELFGRSAHRAVQGERALAADFQTRAMALEAYATELSDKAFQNRLEAGALEWRMSQSEALAAVAA